MEKYLFHSIMNSEYLGIVTILDYEMRLSSYLSELVFPSCFKGKKALVDLALKSGVDEYRFVAFDVDDNGKIILNSNSYIKVSKEIEKAANFFLQQRRDIVNNSFLTDTQKKKYYTNLWNTVSSHKIIFISFLGSIMLFSVRTPTVSDR